MRTRAGVKENRWHSGESGVPKGAPAVFDHIPLFVFLSVVGCGIAKPPLFLALETDHFEIYREEGLPAACATTAQEFEGFLQVFEDYLGVRFPEDRKIIYNQFDTYGYLADLCGLKSDHGASGCYNPDGDVIASLYPVHPHEIAHVLEHRVGGTGRHPRLFEEGIASLLGGGESYDEPDHRVNAKLPLDDLVDGEAFEAFIRMPTTLGDGAVYSSAAGFVRYLIDTYGRESFLEFYASVRDVTVGAVVRQKMESAFGLPFGDVVKGWRSSVQPLVEDLTPAVPGCDQPAQVVDQLARRLDPACEATRMRFDVPLSGRLDLVLNRVAERPSIVLWSCRNGMVMPERPLLLNGGMRLGLDVTPGPYEMIVRAAAVDVATAPTPVTIDVDGTCDPAHVPAVIGAQGSAEFALVRRWGDTEKSVAFDVVAQSAGAFDVTSVGGTFYPGTTPRRFYLCPDACVSDLDGQCRYDDEPRQLLPDGSIDNTHDVLGKPVAPGDLLHFATGPRYQQDWGYSVRLSVH